MTELINLKIKIASKDKYKKEGIPGSYHQIEVKSLEIIGQDGRKFLTVAKQDETVEVADGEISVSDIRFVELNFDLLSIPLAWLFENKGSDSEVEIIIKNFKYDKEKGISFSSDSKTFDLEEKNFQFEESLIKNRTFTNIFSIIDLVGISPEAKKIFADFRNLFWEISQSYFDENITRFITKIKEWEGSTPGSLKNNFYELKSILEGEEKEVKGLLNNFLEVIESLQKWKNVGIKTIAELFLANRNGFDIIKNPSLESEIEEGKYKGFSISREEEIGSFLTRRPQYSKGNIDIFRECFPNDMDKDDPQYFRGFQPGDIWLSNKGWLVYDKFVIEHYPHDTRTTLEISKAKNLRELKEAILSGNSFQEKEGQNKKQHLEMYKNKALGLSWIPFLFLAEQEEMRDFYTKLINLFSILDKPSHASESESNCRNGFAILQHYKSPAADSDEEKIKNKWEAEINQKRQEIINHLAFFKKAVDLKAAVGAAADAKYYGKKLTDARKEIFTTHKAKITSLSILDEIKELIGLLIQAEISTDADYRQNLLTEIKAYQGANNSSNEKIAYNIVNSVDNKWVERTITKLEERPSPNPEPNPNPLKNERTRLINKYSNSAEAQAIFGNSILDTEAALTEAEQLLLKAKEAQNKNDFDLVLKSFLEGYQNAGNTDTKNKAWQAVNGYNNLAQSALDHLKNLEQLRNQEIKKLQEARNESDLATIYQQIINSEFCRNKPDNKQLIDKIHRRKQVCFLIAKDNQVSPANKNFLQTTLMKLIPGTITNDQEETELTNLENQLKEYKNTNPSEEKGKIYQNLVYQIIINQLLQEISQEKLRYQQTKPSPIPHDNGLNKDSGGGLPMWGIGLIVVVIVAFLGIIYYLVKKSQEK